jgi:hypothetical protein
VRGGGRGCPAGRRRWQVMTRAGVSPGRRPVAWCRARLGAEILPQSTRP